eukprot:869252-Amorphochlora_amoeboformis.AAC.1
MTRACPSVRLNFGTRSRRTHGLNTLRRQFGLAGMVVGIFGCLRMAEVSGRGRPVERNEYMMIGSIDQAIPLNITRRHIFPPHLAQPKITLPPRNDSLFHSVFNHTNNQFPRHGGDTE